MAGSIFTKCHVSLAVVQCSVRDVPAGAVYHCGRHHVQVIVTASFEWWNCRESETSCDETGSRGAWSLDVAAVTALLSPSTDESTSSSRRVGPSRIRPPVTPGYARGAQFLGTLEELNEESLALLA